MSKDKYKKIIKQMEEQSSKVLVNLCFLDMKIDDMDSLKEIADAIDDLYENYAKLLKIYKKLRESGKNE